jgi:O-antigen/teichoic acid export membrane protein
MRTLNLIYDRFFNWCGITRGKNTDFLIASLTTVVPILAVTKALTFGLQVFAGRWLGPEQYGCVNLILSASAILSTPMSLYAVHVMKLASMSSDRSDQSAIVSSTLWAQVLWIGALTLLAYVGRSLWIRLFHLPVGLWTIAVPFTAITVLNIFVYQAMQGLKIFTQRAWCELAYGVTSVTAFLYFYYCAIRGYAAYMDALMIGLGLSAAVAFYYLSPWLKMNISSAILLSAKTYVIAPFINGIPTALLNSFSPLLLAHVLSVSAVGIFSAYRLGSVMMANVISVAISVVLFPLTTTPDSQKGAWDKLLKLTLPLLAGSWLLFAATTAFVIKAIGKAYPMEPFWLIVFAGAATCCLIYTLAATMLSAAGAAGMWFVVLCNVLLGLAFVGANLFWTPHYGVIGAAYSLLASYFGATLLTYVYGFRRFIDR